MPGPCSLDLRRRVVAAVGSGVSCRVAADQFDVSPSSVSRWTRRANETGEIAHKPMGGPRRDRLGDERRWILRRIVEKPDLTLHAMVDELRDRGLVVAVDTLWRFLKREGLSFKKNAVRERATEARRRAAARALEALSGTN
jgi:transposase